MYHLFLYIYICHLLISIIRFSKHFLYLALSLMALFLRITHHSWPSGLMYMGCSFEFTTLMNKLQDYLAAPTTTDLAYGVILEHTIAERERR